jgi:hypothetical protein
MPAMSYDVVATTTSLEHAESAVAVRRALAGLAKTGLVVRVGIRPSGPLVQAALARPSASNCSPRGLPRDGRTSGHARVTTRPSTSDAVARAAWAKFAAKAHGHADPSRARAVQRRLSAMGIPVIDMQPWDAPQIERLSQLWREGHSGGAIAKAMGITRGAVMGKLHKLGRLGTRQRRTPVKPRPRVERRGPWKPQVIARGILAPQSSLTTSSS